MEVVSVQGQMEVLRLEELREPYAVEDVRLNHVSSQENFVALKLQVEVRAAVVAVENSKQDVAVIVVRLVEVVVRTYLE